MSEEKIRQTLKQVLDPEVGVNIVDLGLVYNIKLNENKVEISITMTSPACPLHTVITRDIEDALLFTFPELETKVNLVWQPPWSSDMMSAEAKKQLGWG